MKLKIPVEVELNGIDGIVDEIKHLQTYKLFEGDDMVLVSLDDVAEILMNHIEAKRKSEPQRMRGRWVGCGNSDHWKCSVCGTRAAFWFNEENSCEWELDMSEWLSDFCPNCGADMRW